MTFRVEAFPRGDAGAADAVAPTISAWRRELFAPDQEIIDAFTWQNKEGIGFNIQTYIGDDLAGFAHVFARMGRSDDAAVLMGCLGSVMTSKQHQGKGVGTATVRRAGEVILKNLRADLGVLVCKSTLVPFYERLGWRRVLKPVVVAQPGGNILWPYESMVLLGNHRNSVPDKLDLCGFPF